MVKRSWSDDMTARAIELHREIVAREARGPGDVENAMRRLEAKYGLDFWSQWVCRYRRKTTNDFATKIQMVWVDLLGRSVKRDLEALRIEEAKGRKNAETELADLVSEAEALLARIAAKKAEIAK